MSTIVQKLSRKVLYGDAIVVVSGLPRSGTSMTSKMLVAGGMTFITDGIRTADEDNPKGYFEDERVKALAQEPDKAWLKDARGKAVKIISYLLKELPSSNNYKVLFMQRNVQEVLASQKKMLERRDEKDETSDERMIELYDDHLFKVRYLLKHQPQFESIVLPYKEVIENPVDHTKRIADFLSRDLDVEKMAQVVDKQLYRNRR